MKNNISIFIKNLGILLFFYGWISNAQQTFIDVTENAGIDHQYEVYEGTLQFLMSTMMALKIYI